MAVEAGPVVGGVAKAAPVTDYRAVTCGCAETPVSVDASLPGSRDKSTATPKSFNKDAYVQSARFGGR